MRPKKIKLSELNPDSENTRIHDRRNIEAIKKSLQRFGQYRPFVVQKQGMIIRVGNGMYQAMKELGWEEGFAEIREMTTEEAIALSITDNRIAELAEWDNNLLEKALNDLPEDLFEVTGFDIKSEDFNINDFFEEKQNENKEEKKNAKSFICQFCGKENFIE